MLAELLGGRVGFESMFGLGSVFWVDFPMRSDQSSLLSVSEHRDQSAARCGQDLCFVTTLPYWTFQRIVLFRLLFIGRASKYEECQTGGYAFLELEVQKGVQNVRHFALCNQQRGSELLQTSQTLFAVLASLRLFVVVHEVLE